LFSIGECPCVATGIYNITVIYVLYVSVATHGYIPSEEKKKGNLRACP
jgi:hypothetical protein